MNERMNGRKGGKRREDKERRRRDRRKSMKRSSFFFLTHRYPSSKRTKNWPTVISFHREKKSALLAGCLLLTLILRYSKQGGTGRWACEEKESMCVATW